MRQVKFRALELDSPSGINWVYGYYVAINGYYMADGVPDLNQPVVRHYIFSDDGIRYEIAESTVGQFTGKNGQKRVGIYEGDIWKRNSFIATVEFKHSGWQLIKTESSNSYQYPAFYSNARLGEIIGNIHENPELLCAKK